MPDLFLTSSVVVEKTSAQKIIESLPKPMQPVIDPSDPSCFSSIKDSNLYKFLHSLCGPFLDRFPQELREMIDGSTLYSSHDFWLEMYGAGLGVSLKENEDEDSFKRRVMNELFRAKVSNKAIKSALQEFSSTPVFVLDRLAVSGGISGDGGSMSSLQQLPFLSIDQQEVRSMLINTIQSSEEMVVVERPELFPVSGYGKIDDEVVHFTKQSNGVFNILRSQKGTASRQHLAGSWLSIYNDVFSLFLDFFNMLTDTELGDNGQAILSGAFEFEVYITPSPNNQNTREEIINIINKFKAAGTMAFIRLGLPYNL